LWQDLPDPEVIRVDDVFYYTASNMHYSPGAPILRSWDLVNWEYIGHAVPVYDYSTKYDLNGGQAYIKGTWASSLHYRKGNKTFYWMGCIDGKTYVYTADAAAGPWSKKSTINTCYYDCGMMVDYDDGADDTMYVAYGGGGSISVAQLGADYLSQVKTQQVYSTNGSMTLEGSHMFKYKNNYYITPTRPANGEFVLKSSSPFGPYEIKPLVDAVSSAFSGPPHQGSLIQIQNGDWYYMAFVDAYPGGRIPLLAPITWGSDGWPSVTLVGGKWAATYPYPNVPKPPQATKAHTGTDTFASASLGAEWEWNHNPDNTKWSVGNGLVLKTATVTKDLYAARNTLTHRGIGPQSTATVQIDVSAMQDGDVAGLALFREASAYIAVFKTGDSTRIAVVSGLTMNTSTWATTSTGSETASNPTTAKTIWLRASMDGRAVSQGGTKQGRFAYSTDGSAFSSMGTAVTLSNDWRYYPGYRYGIFNIATSALGGAITVKSFQLTTP
jgi:beta-xylosidase